VELQQAVVLVVFLDLVLQLVHLGLPLLIND
jgi:hypothetical protein